MKLPLPVGLSIICDGDDCGAALHIEAGDQFRVPEVLAEKRWRAEGERHLCTVCKPILNDPAEPASAKQGGESNA